MILRLPKLSIGSLSMAWTFRDGYTERRKPQKVRLSTYMAGRRHTARIIWTIKYNFLCRRDLTSSSRITGAAPASAGFTARPSRKMVGVAGNRMIFGQE